MIEKVVFCLQKNSAVCIVNHHPMRRSFCLAGHSQHTNNYDNPRRLRSYKTSHLAKMDRPNDIPSTASINVDMASVLLAAHGLELMWYNGTSIVWKVTKGSTSKYFVTFNSIPLVCRRLRALWKLIVWKLTWLTSTSCSSAIFEQGGGLVTRIQVLGG